MALTASATSLRSGIHRPDICEMTGPDVKLVDFDVALDKAMNMATRVVARWLSEPLFLDADGNPDMLPRAQEGNGFDALVASVSSDIRPRAVFDELLRLGMAQDTEGGVQLLQIGFTPRQVLAEMAQLF